MNKTGCLSEEFLLFLWYVFIIYLCTCKLQAYMRGMLLKPPAKLDLPPWDKDLRDERPLIYPGRVLVPASALASKMFWKKSSLFTDGRTQQAAQLSGKEMRVIEKVGDGHLPGSTDADFTVRAALKTAQIGGDAASKIFKLLTAT